MSNSFSLIWQDASGIPLEQLTFPIIFPGVITDGFAISLRSTAASNLTFESLVDVSFALTGSDVPMVQGQWPYITDVYGVASSTVTGGFEISFDNGLTWTRFSKTVGWAADSSTWLALPQQAVGSAGIAGQISAFDAAHMLVRYVIPPSVQITKLLDISLAVNCDIV